MRIPKPKDMQHTVFRFFPQEAAKQIENHWQEQWRWAKQFSNYFPKRYKSKIADDPHWRKVDWKKEFKGTFNQLHTEKNTAFLVAVAEGDLSRLREIVEEKKRDPASAKKEVINIVHFLAEEDCLSPDRPNDSAVLREIIWDLITHTLAIASWPSAAIVTYQPEATVINLLQNRVDLNSLPSWRSGGIFYTACERGYAKLVQFALARGANINKRVKYKTPLHAACSQGHVNVVRVLLDPMNTNLEIDAPEDDDQHLTPLHYASQSGQLEIAQLLLERGANIQATDCWGSTALHEASANGQVEIVRLLLDRQANVDSIDGSGNTPLADACDSGKLETARLLLDRGANVNGFVENNANAEENVEWSSPLSLACFKGYTKIVTLLLERGADINGNHADKMPPLDAACCFGAPGLVEVLLQRGAKANHAYRSLHLVCGEKSDLEIARLLIQHGADLNNYDSEGYTPLTRACWGGNLKIIELLLDSNADVNAEDRMLNTPLSYACNYNKPQMAKLLVDRKANVFTNALWSEDTGGEEAKIVVLEKIFEKMAFEDQPESKAFHEKLVEKYHSDLVPICALRSDLLLLAAITTAQALEKIKQMLSAEPKILDEEYRETLCALAHRFHPEVLHLLLPESAGEGAGHDSFEKRPRSTP